jgi:hypothetical protein
MPRPRHRISALLILVTLAFSFPHTASCGILIEDFEDIQLWTGEGPDQAALVLDWNDGKDAQVWGYRFDATGSVTSSDMIRDITQAQSRLFLKYRDFGSGGQPDIFITGWGLDRDGDGFSISDGTDFTANGGYVVGGSDIANPATANDPNDSYMETLQRASDGEFEFWNFWFTTNPSYPGGGDWTFANFGPSSRDLENNSWEAYSFGVNESAPPTSAFAAVPEPTSIALMSVMLCFATRRRVRT